MDNINETLKQFGGGTGISFRLGISSWLCVLSSFRGREVIGRGAEPNDALNDAVKKYFDEKDTEQ